MKVATINKVIAKYELVGISTVAMARSVTPVDPAWAVLDLPTPGPIVRLLLVYEFFLALVT